MPSMILYREEKSRSNEPELLGYCQESPMYVLLRVFRDYRVFKYKNIITPIDHRLDRRGSGLIILESEAPKGTAITSGIDDLDLSIAREPESRDEEVCYNALRDATGHYLMMNNNYFNVREAEPSKLNERLLKQLLEVAFVTLKISNPTPKDLEFIASD